jgi:hypothetical protein
MNYHGNAVFILKKPETSQGFSDGKKINHDENIHLFFASKTTCTTGQHEAVCARHNL